MSSSSSIYSQKIRLLRAARIAQRGIVGKNGNAESLKLKERGISFKMESSAPLLPKEILFSILLLFPADILCNVMRYVCQEWYNVINDPRFINAHLQKSTDCLLIQCSYFPFLAHFVEIHGCDIQLRKLRDVFPQSVYCSCEGFTLFRRKRMDIYYVGNPITRQLVTLPQLPTDRVRAHALTYVRSTGKYKVMIIVDEDKYKICLIVTVGADNAWRPVDTKRLRNLDRHLISCRLFSTGGYIYLTSNGANLFAWDVEAEIFHKFPVPNVYHKAIRATYIVWKSFIALVAHCAEFVWELWALTDLNTGVWTRCFSFDLSGQKCIIEQMFESPNPNWTLDHYLSKKKVSLDRCLVPIAFLKNGEVVIFRGKDPFRTYIVYKLKTGEVSSFILGKLDEHDDHATNIYLSHVNSFVSLNSA